jgi:hypothetical protein
MWALKAEMAQTAGRCSSIRSSVQMMVIVSVQFLSVYVDVCMQYGHVSGPPIGIS